MKSFINYYSERHGCFCFSPPFNKMLQNQNIFFNVNLHVIAPDFNELLEKALLRNSDSNLYLDEILK